MKKIIIFVFVKKCNLNLIYNMKKIRISVVGLGHIGKIHCKLLAKNKSVDFVGVYDIDIKRKYTIAAEYKVKYFADISDTILNSDAVIIATSTIHHKEIAKKVILAGKHCFIEKPVCSNVKEAEELLRLSARHHNLKIQVGHIERLNPAILSAKRYNLNPVFIEAHRLTEFQARSTDISVVNDLMIHDIDLVLFLTNSKVKNIYASGVSIITDSIDLANARLELENGLIANLTASRISTKSERKFRIFQKDTYLSLNLKEYNLEIFKMIDCKGMDITADNLLPTQKLIDLPTIEDKKIVFETPKITKANSMEIEQSNFISSIIGQPIITCTLYEGVEALKVAERISEIIAK